MKRGKGRRLPPPLPQGSPLGFPMQHNPAPRPCLASPCPRPLQTPVPANSRRALAGSASPLTPLRKHPRVHGAWVRGLPQTLRRGAPVAGPETGEDVAAAAPSADGSSAVPPGPECPGRPSAACRTQSPARNRSRL